jgi:serine protease Do
VILKSRDGSTGTIKKPAEPDAITSLGIELEEVEGKVIKKLDLDHGVRVTDLGNGKVARYTEMKAGFIITKVNDVPVGSVKEFKELVNKKRPGDLIILSGTYEDIPREFNYALRR